MRYEVRFCDRQGKLSYVRELEFENDDEAINRLIAQPRQHAMELWGREMLIFRFDARGLWR